MKKLMFALAMSASLFCRAEFNSSDDGKMRAFAPITLLDSNLDFWVNVPPNTVLLPTVSKVYRNEKFLYLPLLVNIVDKDGESFKGKYRLSYRRLPDGELKTYSENTFDGKQNKKSEMFLLNPTVVFMFEDSDELGKYEFVFDFENLSNGTSTSAKTNVVLADWTHAGTVDEGELSKTMTDFNKSFSPETLYSLFSSPSCSFKQNGGVNYSAYYFFLYGLKKHDFLLKIIAKDFGQMKGEQRFNALVMMSALNAANLAKGATPAELEAAKEFNAAAANLSFGGARLDSYWGEFFATGRAQPMYNVIEEMLKKHDAGKKLFKKLSGETVDISKTEIMDGAVFGAAGWSLAAIMNSNDLAKKFAAAYIMRMKEADKLEFLSAFEDAQKLSRKMRENKAANAAKKQ